MNIRNNDRDAAVNRRDFVKTTAAIGAGAVAGGLFTGSASAAGRAERIRVGLIGCGGRGTGAAVNALEASPDCELIAMGDVFKDRLDGSLGWMRGQDHVSDRILVEPEHCHVGFDAYKKVIAGPVDLVILATPPHFRPIHLEHAINNSKHVFMEKPVAVDPAGVRTVINASDKARSRNLGIVAGTQRRHEKVYLETMQKIENGEIGRIIAGNCYWNQGGLWAKEQQTNWTDMEWQLRNWLYFTWLSGDHIVEQHIHNMDVMNWAIGDHPSAALGLGGREVRTEPLYGHIFDHFAIEYTYPSGASVTSMCRQINGTDSRVEEVIRGTKGTVITSSGRGRIEFADGTNWKFSSQNPNPYVVEHADLQASIRSGRPLNEGVQVAESTLTAIMGRMSTYTGKVVTWDQAINSQLNLAPDRYEFGSLPMPAVAVPGKTKLI